MSLSSSQRYESDMKVGIDKQATEQIAAVNAGAARRLVASGMEHQKLAEESRRNYHKELDANRAFYTRCCWTDPQRRT
jgi:hypothetical protein